MTVLLLKRASASRPSGEWNEDDFDVLADGVVVGRIMNAAAVPVGQSWMWTLAFGYHEDRTPTLRRARTLWRPLLRAGGASEPKRCPFSARSGHAATTNRVATCLWRSLTTRWKRGIIPPLHE
jgi:hypothetical protein